MSLFGDNLFFVYFFCCLTILNYGSFKENQKILLLYIISFGLCFLNITGSKNTILLLVMLLFVFTQYLSEDLKKLQVITKFRYKLLDFAFHIIFQYETLWVILAILCNSYKVKAWLPTQYGIIRLSSLLIFGFSIHRLSSQTFKVKSITQLMAYFDSQPIYNFPYDDDNFYKYEMLTRIEDKTYFIRSNSYNFLSIEFIFYKLKRFRQKYLHKGQITAVVTVAKEYVRKSKNIRGYSTIEMQLIRSIGIERGYKCVIRRKIYEFIYGSSPKCVLDSL